MKRNIAIIIVGIWILASCSFELETADDGEAAQQIAQGDMGVRIFVPDYRTLSEQGGRAVAPHTAYVRLSISDDGVNYLPHAEMALNMNNLTPVQNAPENLPGGTWDGTFSALLCKTYAKDSLKIELLDKDKRVITSGTNQETVEVIKGQPAQAVFFTTPEVDTGILGSLAAGDMVFWKVSLKAGYEYRLVLTSESSWPDIVVFNNDGTFREYHRVSSSAEGEILFNPEADNDCYVGVWADSGAVNYYSVSMSYNFDIPQLRPQDLEGDFGEWTASAEGYSASPPVLVTKDERLAVAFNSRPMGSGGRMHFSRTFTFTEPTLLNFIVKTDIDGDLTDTYLKLYVDGVEEGSYEGQFAPWRRAASVTIPAGDHEIRWTLVKDSYYYIEQPSTNTVWLADISFVRAIPDVTEYLEILPRGIKETYVGGFPIQFTANALRADGSVRRGASGFTFTGTGVTSSGLFTPPSTPGTYRVTASLDGKSVISDIITVHPANYKRNPYTNPVTGRTWYGYQSPSGPIEANIEVSDRVRVTYPYPTEEVFDADGFVTVEGVTETASVSLFIAREDNPSFSSYQWLPGGRFSARLWMRFGPGRYTVSVNGNTLFTVNNTCTDTGDGGDPRFSYPSSAAPWDDFIFTNLLTHLLYGVSNEREKVRRVHDYLIQNTVYDMDSVTGEWKGQDAYSVLGTRYHLDPNYEPEGHFLAVCEGYSRTALTLLRAAGFQTRLAFSNIMNHVWNDVYVEGAWRFMDVTWDDPIYDVNIIADFGPDSVTYSYFLLDYGVSAFYQPHDKGDTIVSLFE